MAGECVTIQSLYRDRGAEARPLGCVAIQLATRPARATIRSPRPRHGQPVGLRYGAVGKDQNIGKHGYIGNWILRKYQKYRKYR